METVCLGVIVGVRLTIAYPDRKNEKKGNIMNNNEKKSPQLMIDIGIKSNFKTITICYYG
jgi:hypothetical protein